MPSPNPPSQYISFAAPDVLSDKVRSFLADFYSISDTPNVHETYADQFSDDAEIVMGANTVKGREGMLFLSIFLHKKASCESALLIFEYHRNCGAEE